MIEMKTQEPELTPEEEIRILRFILACDGYVNLPYILHRLYHVHTTPQKDYNEYMKHYMRLYRKIKRLEKKELVATSSQAMTASYG